MHRLLADTTELESGSPVLSKAAKNHLKVLRLQEGEKVELFDGKGNWRCFSFVNGGLKMQGPLMSAAKPQAFTLFACVTKGSRWDWTIEKATELGVTRIVPVISARTIVRIAHSEREAKRERWLRIAEDAARQSDSKWVPQISAPVDFASALELVKSTRCLVGALTTPPPKCIMAALLGSKDAPCRREFSLFIGPEGDFTPEELSLLLEVAEPVSFGDTILRAETASIYGLSVIKSFLDANV
jgi:16S rRNA (uracil1498-N3)-methyltransferase